MKRLISAIPITVLPQEPSGHSYEELKGQEEEDLEDTRQLLNYMQSERLGDNLIESSEYSLMEADDSVSMQSF